MFIYMHSSTYNVRSNMDLLIKIVMVKLRNGGGSNPALGKIKKETQTDEF